MAITNTITFAKGTSAPDGSTGAAIGQPLFHYATDGSVANLYVGHDTDDGDNTWIGAPILDQDNMSSNSATSLATQQSIVAYVTAQITAEDLDVTGDSGAIDIDLNSETLVIAGGSGITTSGSSATITVAGDDASTSAKGVASFSSDNFAVSSGAVTIKDDGVAIAELSATGTASSSTFLRGDNTWSAPTSGAVTAINNATANELVTIGSTTTELDAEANLTYDGTVLTISDAAGADTLLKLVSTDTGAGDAPRLDLARDSSSPANADEIGRIRFNANQTDGALKTYAGIEAKIVSVSNSAHSGKLNLQVAVSGTQTTIAEIDSGGLNLVSGYDYEIAGTNVLNNNTLGSGVVTSSLTAVGTIGTGVWQGTAIASGYIAADAITSAKIADDAIDSEHYTDGSIDNAHIADDAIDSEHYAAGSIDDAHLSDGVATGLAGAGTTASSGVLNVIGGNGITANANDIAVTAAQTTITSVLSDSLKIGRADGQDSIDFGSDDTILFDVDNTERMRVDAAGVDITGNLTVTGNTTVVNILAGAASNTIQFEGTADDYETTLTVVDPTADRTISLPNNTGTVVTTGSGTVITAGMLGADCVTAAKIGDDVINSEHYAAGSIDNEHIADDAINSEHYADGSIDLAHMSADSIDSTQYVDGSIDAAHYAAGSVDATALGADAVTASHIGDNVLNSEHYAAASIDNEHLADNAVDSAELAAGAVDNAHLAGSIANGKLSNSAVTYTAGVGLSGGGAVSLGGSATLTLDMSELTDMTATMVGGDEFIVLDGGADRRKAASEIGLSIFSNDAGFGTGDITGVTAGVGLSGGGASGGVTLTLDLSELSAVTPVVGDWLATLDSDGAVEQLTLVSALDTLLSATAKTLTNKTISGGTY